MEIKLFCPAKINLFLEVLDKREDNYHNLDTIMMSVNLFDTVDIILKMRNDTENVIKLICNADLPTDSGNIAYRAVERFLEAFEKKGYDITVIIDKRIPMAAGLAGGSADCAGVLLGLEHLFCLQNRHDEVLALGAKLGADVPFCMTCGCVHATGIGDVMEGIRPITPDWAFVVAKGGEGVSTAKAYSVMDRRTERRSSEKLRHYLRASDIPGVCSEMYNAFEEVVCPERPMVQRAKDVLLEKGALGALMSGSGPSVFGIFSSLDDAENAQTTLESMGYEAFVCFSVM